ncbi:TPA: hypothetical protein QCK25_001378 [Enterobacter mori]|uniref:hypothetical protein n=1 Tax=Enterobacter mori TaxID=539813 RepID=UPI002A818F58|nr:hypothetical protein [Enterobacter mori]HDR2756764.1 hypothetical protein [Enterobacter mori]HDR2780155.1 hypothetical protein [Enterobacter mori]HDR2833257.1 hypothetical protein [Enterobacter mori]
MTHIFYEFPSLKPGVPDVETLMEVINSSELTSFVIGAEVVDFVKKALIVNTTIGSFKNCYFAFDNGTQFLEFDGKGKSKRFNEIPEWFVSPAEFSRTQWLINHDLADVKATQFIDVLMSYPLKERRAHCNLLFGLELEKVNAMPATAPSASKIGNKNGKTTKPRVMDLGSFELFSQFFERMKTAVLANEFPTLQVLTGMDNLSKAPHALKQGIRTWFKAIAGDLPPNNKRVEAGNSVLFCAPIREQIQQIEAIGLENYYQGLSKAITEASDSFIADFTYSHSVN